MAATSAGHNGLREAYVRNHFTGTGRLVSAGGTYTGPVGTNGP